MDRYGDTLERLTPPQGFSGKLNSVLQDVSKAKGLPNRCYVDAGAFAEEERALFREGWAGVGFAHQVPEPGDVFPINFLGAPLLLSRDSAGTVRLFENVCRHRGMILVEEPRKIEGAIRCPYHSWCYGLDGRLVATPHVGGPGRNIHPDVDRGALGLIEVPSEVWMGVVFANLSGDAAPFREAHADLIARWAEFDQPLYHGGPESSFTLDVRCNWKLAVENYCESYHLPWVHPGLNSYSRLEDHYNIVEYGRYSGQGTLVYRPQLSEDGRRFGDFPNLSQKWDQGAEYVTLFPNVMFGVHRDHSYAILLDPQNVGHTIERVEIFYAAPASLSEGMRDLRVRNAEMWREVFEEDVFVVEGMQRGRGAPRFDGGKFSPAMDAPTHVFHHWAASRLNGGSR
ncbi:MAG: aromatic ring-hydroxylating dioxygenase subunit alpha [Rhodobacteraceae bacterium]|nr:aromatic ring-hydroxylating dioxygenase subunit alpha [Paracoccaceae bacterium]